MDSRQYEYADGTLNLGGRDIIGIRGWKYSEKIEREALHAKGRYGHSIQSGNHAVEGEFSVTQSELETLIAEGKGSILNLKLDGILSYGNPSNGDTLITDKIVSIMFTESAKEMKQGDKFMEVTLPWIALRVMHQIA